LEQANILIFCEILIKVIFKGCFRLSAFRKRWEMMGDVFVFSPFFLEMGFAFTLFEMSACFSLLRSSAHATPNPIITPADVE